MASEVRLIDANAFYEQLEEIRMEYLEEDTLSSNFAAKVIEMVQDSCLKNTPTIDPESLRPKGRWEEITEEEDGTVHYRCTNCGQLALEKRCPGAQIGVTHAKFCLECGAKMEG